MAIFSGDPGLAGFIGAKDDGGGGGDNWSYKTCKAPVKSSPTNQHPAFYRPDVLPVTSVRALKGKLLIIILRQENCLRLICEYMFDLEGLNLTR